MVEKFFFKIISTLKLVEEPFELDVHGGNIFSWEGRQLNLLELVFELLHTVISVSTEAGDNGHQNFRARGCNRILLENFLVEGVADGIQQVGATPVKVLEGISVSSLAELLDVKLYFRQLKLPQVMNETQALLGLGMNILEDVPHAIFDEMVANDLFVGGQSQG